MKRIKLRNISLFIFLIRFIIVPTSTGQDSQTFLNYLRRLEVLRMPFGAEILVRECKRFLTTYPLSDSCASVLVMLSNACLRNGEKNIGEAALAAVKAAVVYDGNKSRSLMILKRCEQPPFQMFYQTSFTELQRRYFQGMVLKYVEGTRAEKGFFYIKELYSIRSKHLIPYLIKEINWFLSVFPNYEKGDRLRFWLASLYHESGRHRKSASCFLAIPQFYPRSPLAWNAVLRASDELSERPIWDYHAAIGLLEAYLGIYSKPFVQEALLRLMVFHLKVKKTKNAAKYFRELFEKYPEYVKKIREKDFRRILKVGLTSWPDSVFAAAQKRYLELYPKKSILGKIERKVNK